VVLVHGRSFESIDGREQRNLSKGRSGREAKARLNLEEEERFRILARGLERGLPPG